MKVSKTSFLGLQFDPRVPRIGSRSNILLAVMFCVRTFKISVINIVSSNVTTLSKVSNS